MSIQDSLRQIRSAQTTTFKKAYEPLEGKSIATLSDESIALIFHVAEKRVHESGLISNELPPEIQGLFSEFQNMKTKKGLFFERFAVFARPPVDGMLVGFGADEMYYVLAVWDFTGCLSWKPTKELYGEPILA